MGKNGWIKKSKEASGMILVQLIMTGMLLLSRVILDQGQFVFALLTYRHLVGAICVAPVAFFMEREMFKMINFSALFWMFFTALSGIPIGIGLFYYGERDTTATYTAEFGSLVPILTFFLSIIFGLERLSLRKYSGKMKVAGVIVCVAGALVFNLYKGKVYHFWSHKTAIVEETTSYKHKLNLNRGFLMLAGSCLGDAIWYVIQVKQFEIFPSKYWATVITCILGSLQSVLVGVVLDRSKAAWRLGWDLQLLNVVYSGVLTTGASFCLISWGIVTKGPNYPAMFSPLALIFTAIAEALLFNEAITIGIILGMIMIILGLYAYLWGAEMELKESPSTPSLDSPLHTKSKELKSFKVKVTHSDGNSACNC
jgi:drug/metabolite transporter (DMT)-like permease